MSVDDTERHRAQNSRDIHDEVVGLRSEVLEEGVCQADRSADVLKLRVCCRKAPRMTVNPHIHKRISEPIPPPHNSHDVNLLFNLEVRVDDHK